MGNGMSLIAFALLVFGFVFFIFGARGFWNPALPPTDHRLACAGLACFIAAYALIILPALHL